MAEGQLDLGDHRHSRRARGLRAPAGPRARPETPRPSDAPVKVSRAVRRPAPAARPVGSSLMTSVRQLASPACRSVATTARARAARGTPPPRPPTARDRRPRRPSPPPPWRLHLSSRGIAPLRSPQLQRRQREQREDERHDPEADDDLRLLPADRARSGGGAAPCGRCACRVSLKEATCRITERASITKRPPTEKSSSSCLIRMATVPSAPPRARLPTSPMKTWAG